MKKKYYGIICLLYSAMIIIVIITNRLKNYLSPTMQIYIEISIIPLIIMGIIYIINNHNHYKFKITDLVLLLPILMLFMAQDGKLTLSLATNRITAKNQEQRKKTINKESSKVEDAYKESNISKIDFDVIDESYTELSSYITFSPKAEKFEGKTIKVRGFILKDKSIVPDGYYALGKYEISCCAADASFTGFIIKTQEKVTENNWYEIEGIIEKTQDRQGYDIMAINVIKIKKIKASEEEQYVYPCYSYGSGKCEILKKYELE